MKRLIFTLLLFLPISARSQMTERIYVSTDRDVYIAGDKIWCSLFCIEKESCQLSPYSAIAYVELVSAEGSIETAKISLLEGRGAGMLTIPAFAPTGNYSLVAYTALNANERGNGYFAGAKTISLFNTTSKARIHDGVVTITDAEYERIVIPTKDSSPGIVLSVSGKGSQRMLNITNQEEPSSLSLSVYRIDDIVPPPGTSPAEFLDRINKEPAPSIIGTRIPEYEGEIIYATVDGTSTEESSGAELAVLSSAGSPSDVYTGKVLENGPLVFFTNNIYGDRELVCSVPEGAGGGYISLQDNFIHPEPEPLPELRLSRFLFSSLVNRKASLAAAAKADTLFTYLRRRQDGLLQSMTQKLYHLDDYTRFNSLEELAVEILSEISIRKNSLGSFLQMVVQDPITSKKTYKNNILVMMDGVVLPSLSLIENIDAMLIEDVVVYLNSFALGSVPFDGAVNFVTGNDYVKALHFPEGVSVVNFKGVSYPMAYRGSSELILWEPMVMLGKNETTRFSFDILPESSNYKVVVEGFSKKGMPVYSEISF